MNGPTNDGFLARLRANETLNRITRGHPDIIIFGAPILVVAIIMLGLASVVTFAGGGGDDGDAQASGDGTPVATRTSESAASPTVAASAGLKTPIAVTPGDQLTLADLAARGAGEPGRGEFTGTRIVIPKIGVDAPFSYKKVGTDGQMPNPNSWNDVAYYDFSQWPNLGGLPGAGGNVVVAGHVDYINHGPAVFWDLHTLAPGDRVQVQMADGSTIEYAIEFNKVIEVGDADWTAIVASTGEESITLITCGGEFSAGHYNNRQILWGRRV